MGKQQQKQQQQKQKQKLEQPQKHQLEQQQPLEQLQMEQESNASNDDAYVISAMASAEQLNEHVCVNEDDSQTSHIDDIQSPQVNAILPI